MAGEASEECTQSLRRGSGDGMYTRETHATREAPWRGRSWRPTWGRWRSERALWGGGEARTTEEAG